MEFSTFGKLNYLAILVATIAYWMLGALWYAPPVFGKRWMAESGVTPEAGRGQAGLFILTFVLYLITVTGLAFVGAEMGATKVNDGIQLGLGVGVAFTAAAIWVTHAYEGRSFVLTAITALYHVVGLVIAGLIVTLWD